MACGGRKANGGKLLCGGPGNRQKAIRFFMGRKIENTESGQERSVVMETPPARFGFQLFICN